MNELVVLLENRDVGIVRQKNGRLSFRYNDSWRAYPGSYPLSLSMPLAAAEHPHSAIEPFIWGLLPDNDLVLQRWAARFQVSARNAFSLISHVGEDCAGAVQFVTPERRDELLGKASADIDWLDEANIAGRLRALQYDAGAGRAPRDTGQFSLAGAQPKTALLFDGKRWGVPSGREPTTHILKPQTGNFDGHAENEHLCLALGRALGLPVAHSEVRRFEDVTAIIVERYDRVDITRELAKSAARQALFAIEAARNSNPLLGEDAAMATIQAMQFPEADYRLIELSKTMSVYRVHQEDFCQALRVHPALKYQNEGGPGPKQIVELLRVNASIGGNPKYRNAPSASGQDIATFIDALIFNWLIGGTDAHAKNYSILIGGGGLVRLAPLYDIASILAYPDIDPKKTKLAMKIGDKYQLHEIGMPQWRKLAAELKVDEGALVERVRALAAELPDCLSDVIARIHASGLDHKIIDVLADVLPIRAKKMASI